jgi:hypothetical protein
VTRVPADAPGTTELLRVDFGVSSTASRVASWTGAPGLLRGEPIRLGERRLFVRPEEIVELDAALAPTVHALTFTHQAVEASASTLWFVANDAAGQPTRLVRWADGAASDLLSAGEYEVGRVVPYSDEGAVVGLTRIGTGELVVARVQANGATTALDVGVKPLLTDGLLLP